MSQPLDEDYYNISDTSDDERGDDEEDIRDITQSINLDAIEAQVLNDIQDDSVLNYFKDRQGFFNKYIPFWINPKLKSYPPRHPALRPDDVWRVEDEWILPSEYAKRFGADKRAPADNPGRSMLSPNNQDPSLDWIEDFQAIVFHGYTADELKAQGAFDPGMHIDDSLDGLTSPLHPLVRRGNWGQARNEGNSFENSKLWYNYTGEDRRWDAATNDEVWEALQPVLQLMSKVLYSNHPFWLSIMDICKISPMDKSRIPVVPQDKQAGVLPEDMWGNMSTLHYELDDSNMYPEAIALRDSGFESTKVVEHILRSYIRFTFGDTIGKGAYATTGVFLNPTLPRDRTEIVLSITPENVWPLLLPTYSKSEKIVSATTLASIMLHELAHCVRDAIAIMTEVKDWHTNAALVTPRPDDDGPVQLDLSQLPQQHQDLLLQLGTKIGAINRGTQWPQFFFQNEFRAEEGWAFENQLWGGVANTVPELGVKDGYPQIVSWLQQWPYSMTAPRPYFRAGVQSCGETDGAGWPNWLLDPPPTMVRRHTALPVTMMSRLYNEEFWSTEVGKFSHQALKFPVHEWGGKPLKSAFLFTHIPVEVLRRSFLARAAWPFLGSAVEVLSTVGEEALSEYIYLRTIKAAGPDVVRRRLHYERKRWATSDAAIDAVAQEMSRLRGVARARLAEYRSGSAGDDQAARAAVYFQQASLIATAGLDIARLLGWEISVLQFGVSECARLEHDGRARLKRFLDGAAARIERKFKPVLTSATATVAELQLTMSLLLGPLPPTGGSGSLQMTIRGRTAAAREVLDSTQTLVEALGRSVDTLRVFDPARHGEGSPTQRAFSLLADRSSDRLHGLRVEKLAQHRLRELPRDSPLLTIVTACYRVLARC